MKSYLLGATAVLWLSVLWVTPQPLIGSKMNEANKTAASAWEKFLTEKFKLSQTEAEVDKLMSGKFRDRGTVRLGGTGSYTILYLIDDYRQITFGFDRFSKLNALPVASPKKPWIRFPDGGIVESDS